MTSFRVFQNDVVQAFRPARTREGDFRSAYCVYGVVRNDDERLAGGIVLIDVDEAIGVGEW
jgi:hypothetical protein